MGRHYRFIGIDEGKQNYLLMDTEQSEPLWIKSLKDFPIARALQKLNGNRILAGFENGYFEFDSRDGAILHICRRWTEVTSACRLENGNTLITGTDLEGLSGVCVLTLDDQDNVIRKVSMDGDYVRLMSLTKDNTFLLCLNDHIGETDPELKLQSEMAADGFLHAWQTKRMSDGTTLVSAGYGAFMALFGADSSLIKTFGTADEVPPGVDPFFYASFQLDSAGNILVANWQDHGPGNGEKGTQLLKFSPDGTYLEGWSFPAWISSLQGLLLLEEALC